MEELAETGLESDDSVGVIEVVGVSSGGVSVLGGGSSTDKVNFDDFSGSSSFWGFVVYEVVTADGDDLLGCTAIGEVSVSLAEAPAFKKAPGGAPANVAVGIARLGGSAAFVGKVGDDEFGHMLSDILKQNNVDNSGVGFDTKARTALAFVTLRADGEREFMFFRNPSEDMLLRESELNKDLLKKASVFHYGSVSLIEEPCRSTQLSAMKIAKKAGCILSYDPNLRLALWPSAQAAKKEIMSIWDQADIIKISEEEISFLTDGADPYDDNVVLKKLFYPNVKLLLVSEGSEGCRCCTKEFKGKVGGVKVNCIDTTGAGDAFVSGLLNSFSADLNLYKASVFLYGSLSLSEEMCRSTQLAALKIAKKAGCILSFDPNLRLALWASPEDAKKELMSIWDWDQENITKISEGEILFLTDGACCNVDLKKLFYPDIKFLLATEGSQGCRYFTKQEVGGVKVNCIDTTAGAGPLLC